MFMVDLGGDNHYTFFGLSPDASASEIRSARDELYNKLETRKHEVQDPAERTRIEEQQKEVGKKGDELARPESRTEYDRKHAHLRFLIVQSAAAPLFRSRVDRVYIIDRAVRGSLAAKGAPIEPLCDLERTDFQEDFTPVAALDRLLEEG
jgi:hypothetical protein